MHKKAEVMFDKGFFVIVQFITTNPPTANMIKSWHENEPKAYCVRICEPNHIEMNKYISGADLTWKDLNRSQLQFKSDARPSARFLYFQYCTTMLKRSWHLSKPGEVLRDELGKPYWGTPGRFMAKSMLLAFVEEMGHEYASLLDGAAGEQEEVEAVETALAAANHQISSRTGDDNYDDDDDDDESENGLDERKEEGEE